MCVVSFMPFTQIIVSSQVAGVRPLKFHGDKPVVLCEKVALCSKCCADFERREGTQEFRAKKEFRGS